MGGKKYMIKLWCQNTKGGIYSYYLLQETDWAIAALYYLFIYSEPGNCVVLEKRTPYNA